MGMFDNYQNITEIPNNTRRFLHCKKQESIVVGGTCSHIFEVPIKYIEDILSYTIIYDQESRLVLMKSPSEITVDEDRGLAYVKCDLTPDETKLFGGTLIDTFVQVKFEYADKVLFSDVYKVKIIPTLGEEGE